MWKDGLGRIFAGRKRDYVFKNEGFHKTPAS